MNPFEDPDLVSGYEEWYRTAGRRADHLERALLGRLVTAFPQAKTALEVGCGTGHFTRWMVSQSLATVGLDVSRTMLAEAASLGSRPLVRGDALRLPFGKGAFDLVALITTLEFTREPVSVLAEALRVARFGLVLGVLNRQSRLGQQRKKEGGPVWDAACFFTPRELSDLVKRAAGGKQISIMWRTTLWPLWAGALPLPWGGFVGMVVELVEQRRKADMIGTAAQVSLYPLGQESLSPAIDEALQIFRRHGLQVEPGEMSSTLVGEDAAIFAALQEAFGRAAEQGWVVMVVTFSNACPIPPREE